MTSMTGFADLVGDQGIAMAIDAASKDDLLAALADVAATETGIASTLILERVREREALGSTGFGQGAAIPHARIAGLSCVNVMIARLARSVDYGALDGDEVDVAVLLLSPEGAGADHLKALARISRALRDPAVLGAIRDASDAAAIRSAIGPASPSAKKAA